MSKLLYPEALLAQFRRWGAQGGVRRAAKLSKLRRQEIARKAGRASAIARRNNKGA